MTLLEAERRKTEFLERWTGELPNLSVIWGRAEEQPLESYGVAVAKALARPPVAAEWCLPLVREGGAVVLWVGPSADAEAVAGVAALLGGELVDAPDGFLVARKTGPTPPGFPRRPGLAKKRRSPRSRVPRRASAAAPPGLRAGRSATATASRSARR